MSWFKDWIVWEVRAIELPEYSNWYTPLSKNLDRCTYFVTYGQSPYSLLKYAWTFWLWIQTRQYYLTIFMLKKGIIDHCVIDGDSLPRFFIIRAFWHRIRYWNDERWIVIREQEKIRYGKGVA